MAQEGITTGDINSFSVSSHSGQISLTSNNGRIDTTAGELNASSIEGNGGNIWLSANGTINTADILAPSFSSNSGQIRLISNSDAIDT
ncbi:MAG: hypothetical protein RIE73_24655, partial [Coleofasciculus sp. C1-SOL-03]|uniref:hypothetical protein n=1 Tax=Coleofasciculus sp. C1-SOL-03 TaxID=3069522 RepID=UPI0032F1155A